MYGEKKTAKKNSVVAGPGSETQHHLKIEVSHQFFGSAEEPPIRRNTSGVGMTFIVNDADKSVAVQRRRRRLDPNDAENRLVEVRPKRFQPTHFGPDVSAESCSSEKLQIESEFRILQSIIPGVSQQENVTEVPKITPALGSF